MTTTIFIMAAGLSKRFKAESEGQHKLLAKYPNRPFSLLATSYHTAAQAFKKEQIVILTNAQEPAISREALKLTPNVLILESDGLGTTIAAGIQEIQTRPYYATLQQLFILPADLPFIQKETLILLQGLFEKSAQNIIRPYFNRRAGHPVGFHRDLFPKLERLSGEKGAQSLLKTHSVAKVPVIDPGILWDIDRPIDLAVDPTTLMWRMFNQEC